MSPNSKTKAPTSTPVQHPISGADIVVAQLVNHGVDIVFAYPGGSVIPLHQAYTRFRDKIRVILPRHEQGGAYAAQGYARSTGKVGVVSATSGPGAANLLTAIADAKLDNVPMVVITGQVTVKAIGTDAFQEMPTTEVFRSITKHHYLVDNVCDLSRIMNEAFYIANTGRKGPVLVDIPKDIQLATCIPDFNAPMNLPGYHQCPPDADCIQIDSVVERIKLAKKPVILAGGGVIAAQASEELIELANTLKIPTASTLLGLGAFPAGSDLSLDMIGMHGSVYSNIAVSECDLLLVFGCRFSDRVTGKISEFAKNAKIVHVDIDSSELNKVVHASTCIQGDVKKVLRQILDRLKECSKSELKGMIDSRSLWLEHINALRKADPFDYDHTCKYILPQQAIQELWQQSKSLNPIVTTGVGQHQMWAAQFFKCSYPRQFLTSGGAGTMGFGIPAAMGAKAANPDKTVLCIDGDGSSLMNIQELATCYCEHLPIKIMILNNQHLGMVVQWEDRFFKGNRAQTYLGPVEDPEAIGRGVGIGPETRYPDFVTIARGFGWEGRHVIDKSDLMSAIAQMLAAKGPYLLDVAVPYQEHVMPMIPAGGSVKDIIRR